MYLNTQGQAEWLVDAPSGTEGTCYASSPYLAVTNVELTLISIQSSDGTWILEMHSLYKGLSIPHI